MYYVNNTDCWCDVSLTSELLHWIEMWYLSFISILLLFVSLYWPTLFKRRLSNCDFVTSQHTLYNEVILWLMWLSVRDSVVKSPCYLFCGMFSSVNEMKSYNDFSQKSTYGDFRVEFLNVAHLRYNTWLHCGIIW